MFGSTVLEIAVGLVFVYLVLSLVVTAASEVIASWLKWRATNLFEGVSELLRDPKDKAAWAQKLYSHPLISALSRGDKSKPSYIPSRTFALALLDLVAPANSSAPRSLADVQTAIQALPAELRQTLTALLDEAGHDLERFKIAMEVWFNTSMERVSGWYKRKAQTFALAAAVAVTLAFNADTLSLVQVLSNEKVRASVLSQAELATKQAVPAPPAVASLPTDPATVRNATAAAHAQFEDSLRKAKALGLPIGWQNVKWHGTSTAETAQLWITRILGWLLTACAVSLGAPFWFDMLNKFMNIRGAGKAPEEEPKDPKEVPRPASPGRATTR